MRIVITMDIDDDFADPSHEMGVTEEGYMTLGKILAPYGDDIDIKRDDG